METTNSITLQRLGVRDAKTYLMALLFIAGNIALPQLCHLIPQGGLIFLPIYFFTLVAAYRYGPAVGLLTAVLSPIVNSALFGMPVAAMLPVIVIKGSILALAASFIAKKAGRVAMWAVAFAVVACQAVGMVAELAITGSMQAALQDVMLGWPGIVLQVVGGWALLKAWK